MSTFSTGMLRREYLKVVRSATVYRCFLTGPDASENVSHHIVAPDSRSFTLQNISCKLGSQELRSVFPGAKQGQNA